MKNTIIAAIVLAAVFFGYQQVRSMDDKMEKPMNKMPEHTQSAVFAGGCFWCTESDYEKVDGVIEAVSGYTGGRMENPTYKQVSAGGTGHVEAVRVTYDPDKVSYGQLLDIFWRHVDPTDAGGQFVDRGDQYRSAIFYANAEERQTAESSKNALAASGHFDRPVVTDILPLGSFYEAEDYHQDYYKKNPLRYNWYRSGSGRDKFLEMTWAGEAMEMEKKMATQTMDGERKRDRWLRSPRMNSSSRRSPRCSTALPAKAAPNRLSTTNIGTTTKRASMWTWYPVSLCSAPRTSSSQERGGLVSPVRCSRTT